MNGPGKYDDETTMVRMGTKARAVVLIVLDGREGSGFSVQAPPHVLAELPNMLESIAMQIRADGKAR
jgi:hypothetical protein